MKRLHHWKAGLSLVLTAALMGSMTAWGCIEKVVNSYNPCGTILNCDPAEYDLMMNSFPDWDLDPTCTIPGQCGGGVFPYGSGTTTTTGGTTTTTQTQTTADTTTGGFAFPFR